MASWKGNILNPSPNAVKEPIARSEKVINDNRAMHVRRDNDSQRDFTIGLMDIDETILKHIENLQLQVTDAGKQIKVPVYYGSPERWTSAQRDGYLRDNQGKMILPAMILKRTTSATDDTLKFFNRYLDTPAIKLYSTKNKYTKFALLAGQNVPVNEVYNVLVPSHMSLTYHFIIWTELNEQMNPLVETIQYNTRDYWGTRDGFRFRTKVASFAHTIELEANEDRVVKTEFDLEVNGYILPDTLTKLDKHHKTTNKLFTPKKLIMGMEVVATDFEMKTLDKNSEKWRSKFYPNLQQDVVIPQPPVSLNTEMIDGIVGIRVDNSPLFLRIVPVPTTSAAGGQEGDMSYDSEYFYIRLHGGWKRVAISEFVAVCTDDVPLTGNGGQVSYNEQFFYIYSSGMWRKVAISEINLTTTGESGNVMYDTEYFYIYTSGSWRRVAIAAIS